jgi:hypothetical protein
MANRSILADPPATTSARTIYSNTSRISSLLSQIPPSLVQASRPGISRQKTSAKLRFTACRCQLNRAIYSSTCDLRPLVRLLTIMSLQACSFCSPLGREGLHGSLSRSPTARIEGAHSDRAPSASTGDRSGLPPLFC